MAELRRDPARRRARRNAAAIVLAKEDQRHGRTLIRRPARGVERPLPGRVIRRGVAEAREHDRIVGERHGGPPGAPRAADRKGGAGPRGPGRRRAAGWGGGGEYVWGQGVA